MTTTDIDTSKLPISTVIGVFLDNEGVNRTIDELRQANFSYERIRVVRRGTGRFVDTLQGLFTGQARMASSTTDDLIQMGMPDYEAQYYQYELDAGHVLLIMNADDRPEAAFSIMRQNGAFDINSRLKLNATGAALKAEKTYQDEDQRTGEEEREDEEARRFEAEREDEEDRNLQPVDDGQTPPVDSTPVDDTENQPAPAARPVPRYVDEGLRDDTTTTNAPPASSDPDAQAEAADRQAARNA
jgi:hypothetical protein